MEMKILEVKKNKVRFEFEGADHAMCNALKMELWQNKDVSVAGYSVSHPLVGKTEFIVETKSGEAKKAVEDALASLKKKIGDLEKKAAKL